ncbi:MAG: UbiA family prenyltransferase [Theionarchaea archaeon]|nr:UbiA family prenyltransferase [Theionarchaea archaeon]MBU7000593.1 UbiA family prenyltransferase [Theionarchaea archaeon]MBU7021717.1 UbiA family prenyltransferase [Theionarchaea archaeon]MBU7036202.1 UbiA family prenyltransferase [Theionarchaea archaeon]MBU7041822.1 UbiA family prenyltransferase [Theionarchaea archaeon]
MSFSSYHFLYHGQSALGLLEDLRFDYAVVSSALILVGFFWNHLQGFSWQVVILVVSVFCGNVFMFVVNDYFDAPHDLRDPTKGTRNVFCSERYRQFGIAVLYTSSGVSLALAASITWAVFVPILLLNVLALLYSAPPVRLRDRMYWDWIFVFFWKGLIIAASYLYFLGVRFTTEPFVWGSLFILLLISLHGQMDNQIRDFHVDKVSSASHTVQKLGRNTSHILKVMLLVFFFGFSILFCSFFNLYVTAALICANLSLYYFAHPEKYSHVMDFAHIWIIVMFLEHFMGNFSPQQHVLFSGWIVIMTGLALVHVKRTNLFNSELG